MLLEYRSKLGGKKRFQLISGQGCTLSSNKADDIVVTALDDQAKVSVFQEGNHWVMMALHCQIEHEGELFQSLDLLPGMQVVVGNLTINIVNDEPSENIPSLETKQGDVNVTTDQTELTADTDELSQVAPSENESLLAKAQTIYQQHSKLILSVLFIATLIWFVMQSTTPTTPTTPIASNGASSDIQQAVTDKTLSNEELLEDAVDTPELSEVSRQDPQTTAVTANEKPIVQPTAVDNANGVSSAIGQDDENDSAYQFYRSALSYYELGLTKQAVQEVQRGLSRFPNHTLLLEKLNRWEEQLNILISQTYRDACRHVLYLRNLEATQAFSLVIEMSIDQQDIRYKEAVRMHAELEKSEPGKRLECGVRS